MHVQMSVVGQKSILSIQLSVYLSDTLCLSNLLSPDIPGGFIIEMAGKLAEGQGTDECCPNIAPEAALYLFPISLYCSKANSSNHMGPTG